MAAAVGTVAIITVLIYNPAAVPAGTLARAQKVAAGILVQCGVTLVWRSAGAADAAPSPAELPLHLLSTRPSRLHPDAGGFAVLHHEAMAENYAGISYPAVVDAASSLNGDLPVVLGAVIAHEIGHVLLGSGTHSPSGIMAARMRAPQVAAASRGELHFTAAQSSAIRAESLRRTR